MITAHWKGKAVSKNKWLGCTRDGKMYQRPEYKTFKTELAWAVKAETKGKVFKKMHLLISSKLPKRFDHQNLADPICDALELAGVVENDNAIGHITMLDPERHGAGEQDEITIFMMEAQ